MKKVFAYARVSGKSQLDGDGFPRQIESIKLFCAARGLEILGERFEKGVSGTVDAMSRPTFSALVEEIECRRLNGEEISGIVVERADRLARELLVAEMLYKECRSRKIGVYAADRGELIDLASDESDATVILIRQVLSAVSQWEKTNLVLKLRKARQRKALEEGRCEGRKRFGHRPEQRAVVDMMRQWIPLNISDNNAARMMNEVGFKTADGKAWNRFSVRRLRAGIVSGRI